MKRDPIELEIFKNIFHSIAAEMGAALRRTAFSPNIRERRDYSCAVFDGHAQVVAMGDHMPVHLGSMPMSVRAAVEDLTLRPGDVAMVNDPFRGGTHLPDITLVAPVFTFASPTKGPARQPDGEAAAKPDFYVASRAHHADVGGMHAGSMGTCREIYQEGFRIPPAKIVRAGVTQQDVLNLFLANVRTPAERKGDIGAQIAACHIGGERLRSVAAKYGPPRVRQRMDDLQDYAEEMMRAVLAGIAPGEYSGEDFLDDDGISDAPIRIAVKLTFHSARGSRQDKRRGSRRELREMVTVDFTGSSPQVAGSVNAVEAIAYSACFYVFRCLLLEEAPAAAGILRPVKMIAPSGSIVNSLPPAAVAGGNVETSQRIVDTLLRAFSEALPERIPAASSGTMNNLTIGGIDARSGQPFAYYETTAGGMGARPTKNGISGIHTHMTNSLNTPVEALEYSYPFRITRYSLRQESGGAGKFRGGDGIVREVELLTDAEVTLLSDRRRRGPYGLRGGADGARGRTEVFHASGESEVLSSKTSRLLKSGDRIRLESPGGGGWGEK